jgi:hypothetical protein
MPKDGLSKKQIEKIIRIDINNIKNSLSDKNNSYSISQQNFNHKVSIMKNLSKILLN